MLCIRTETTIKERTHHRIQLGLGNDVEFEIVDRLTDHPARFQQFDFCCGSRGGREHIAAGRIAQQATNALGLLLDLNHRIGLVHRGGQ